MIDDHVHPFPLQREPFDPAGLSLAVSAGPDGRRAGGEHRLAVRVLAARLAGYLGCRPAELAEARTAAAADWPAYVRGLFDQAGLAGLVMDLARGAAETGGLSRYAELAGRPVWELQRIEPTVDELLAAGAGADEVLSAVDRLMSAAAARGCVGFKTVLAYRTGLAVDPAAGLGAARTSVTGAEPVRRRAKPLRDLLLRRVLARCADLDRPLQVHTGFGDSELDPRTADPLLLDPLLRTPEGRAADVVLIHGSWPWHDSLGYLASVHPNVWAEFSLVQLFAPLSTADRLLRLLDVAPLSRVTLGSDGHGSVESIWYGCTLLGEAWRQVEQRLAGAGLDAGWLAGVREDLFTGNARRLYRLGS